MTSTEPTVTEATKPTEPFPMVLAEAEVRAVERVSPSFVRLELGGPGLADVGVDGALLDQRFKLIVPPASGVLPDLVPDESWWASWMEVPEEERGSMRTYTVREVVQREDGARLVVDVVVHDPAGEDGRTGPGNDWARGARVGDRAVVIAPRRGHDFGGIEFLPGAATRLLVVGDETAVPAVHGILRDLPTDARGCALLEVPTSDDVQPDLAGPDGVDVVWLPRDGAPRSERLRRAVLERLEDDADLAATEVDDAEVDPDLWETPAYSSSGEEVAAETGGTAGSTPFPGLYAWIAGESRMVTGLRRHLVKDLGVDRSQVAFMGYWREGVPMRS